MQSNQKRALQSFRRVQGWLAAHPELLAAPRATGSSTSAPAGTTPVTPLAQMDGALGSVVHQVSNGGAVQEAHDRAARGATAESRRLRVELIKHQMKHVADFARSVIPETVKATSALRMPPGRIDTERLLLAAEAMAKAGEQFRVPLVQRGLPADFVEQLRAVAGAYKAAIDSRGQAVAVRRGARDGIVAATEQGKRLVVSLSVLIMPQVRNNPVLLAEWMQLKRVTLKGVRSIVPTTETPVGPVQAQAPMQQAA